MDSSPKNIVDAFGRIHDYLRISLTEKCNLRCVYCMPEDGVALKENSKYMNKNELLLLAENFVQLGVKKIRLTGGEPFVRKDVAEIIQELSKLPAELAITTNGILIDKHLDTLLQSGVKSINVSLDTLNKERFNQLTRRNYFDKVMSNIDLLIKNNFHVKLNAVLIKGQNDNELIDFIEFTRHSPLHYRFIEFMPFDGNNWNWSKGISYNEIVQKATLHYGEDLIKIEDKKNDTSKNFKIKGYAGTFAIISSVTNPFCDSCNRIRVTADGKLKNCLFSDSETDLLTSIRKGEDIKGLILESILNKKKKRGGMNTFSEFSDPLKHGVNRSMVSIGG